MSVVVGIDPSLTSLGLAGVIDGMFGPVGRVVSKGHTTDTLGQRWRRQNIIVERVLTYVGDYEPDLTVIEGPSYASKNGHPHDRSGLWWRIVDALFNAGYSVIEVPPTSRMKYATGKGNVGKDIVMACAIKRYPKADITGNDVADAVILAAMGSRHLGAATEESLPVTHLAAMDAIHW
jgi:crossover junction endodeoxyribonuclease RuvC